MNLESGKKLVLAALVLLVGWAVYSALSNRPTLVLPPVKTSLKSPETGHDEKLLTALLSRKQPYFAGVRRNVFEFGSGESLSDEAEVAVPQASAQTAVAQSAAVPPAPEVRYMGYYKERQSASARLAAIVNGGQIFVGGVGDILGDKYRVVEINEEYLVLQLIHEDNRVLRLPLGKQ